MTEIIIFLIVVIILVMIECVREILTFKVTHYNINSSKLNNIKDKKIILLSDLHNCRYGTNNEKLLNAIKKEAPDLILVAGDMLVGKAGDSAEVAIEFMKELSKIAETYYANGNHEQRMKEQPEIYGNIYQEYKNALVKNGIHILENEKAQVILDGAEIDIFGLEIPSRCYRKFQKITFPTECMEKNLGKANLSRYQILIAHNPIFAEEYVKWGADLIVSGHLHGGVARIPFWRGVITPQGGLFPKYSGEMMMVGETAVVVSKGIGIHTIPIRFLNPAEVVVLHLMGE